MELNAEKHMSDVWASLAFTLIQASHSHISTQQKENQRETYLVQRASAIASRYENLPHYENNICLEYE